MADLINQPSAMPTRKVAAGTIGAAITAGLIAALRVYKPELIDFAGPLIEQFVPVLVGFVSAYMTRNRAE
jgi:uncharacterized protein YacL